MQLYLLFPNHWIGSGTKLFLNNPKYYLPFKFTFKKWTNNCTTYYPAPNIQFLCMLVIVVRASSADFLGPVPTVMRTDNAP